MLLARRACKARVKAGNPGAGVIARQRKNEVEELNERLRKINLSLRQQVRMSG